MFCRRTGVKTIEIGVKIRKINKKNVGRSLCARVSERILYAWQNISSIKRSK